jgi:hypothetical protein
MKLKLETQEKKLDDLIAIIKAQKDDELKAHLSRYFCIKISGYLENVLKTLIYTYCDGTTPRPIVNFLETDTKNLTNLSEEKLFKFLKKFGASWDTQVDNKFTDSHRSSLNSIISNRNNIAHGQSDSISPKIIEGYYVDLKEIVSILKSVIKK